MEKLTITKQQYLHILETIKNASETHFHGTYFEYPEYDKLTDTSFSIDMAPNYESIIIKIEFRGDELQHWIQNGTCEENIEMKIKTFADGCRERLESKHTRESEDHN